MIIINGRKEVSASETLSLDESGELLYLKFRDSDLERYKSLIKGGKSLALGVADIKELVYACNVGAKYAIANKEDAAVMQKIVDSYLYDTKLLAIIYEEDEIEWAAMAEIDGVVFDKDEQL